MGRCSYQDIFSQTVAQEPIAAGMLLLTPAHFSLMYMYKPKDRSFDSRFFILFVHTTLITTMRNVKVSLLSRMCILGGVQEVDTFRSSVQDQLTALDCR